MRILIPIFIFLSFILMSMYNIVYPPMVCQAFFKKILSFEKIPQEIEKRRLKRPVQD